MSLIQLSIRRVDSFLTHYDTESPAEIIADLIHYCQVKGLDFDRQIELARSYVQAEVEADNITRS